MGHVQVAPTTGGVLLNARWAAPHGGSLVDHFHLAPSDPDTLYVDTAMTMEGGAHLRYRTVYQRRP